MRKYLALLFAILAVSMAGCGPHLPNSEVTFYYRQDPSIFQFGTPDAVIAPEQRSFTSAAEELPYLLSIYLQGPQDPLLRSPFPLGTELLEARQEDDTLFITLDAPFARLENLDLTLACACMAKTCAGLTDAQQICIQATDPAAEREVSMTLRRDQLLLEDTTELSAENTIDSN